MFNFSVAIGLTKYGTNQSLPQKHFNNAVAWARETHLHIPWSHHHSSGIFKTMQKKKKKVKEDLFSVLNSWKICSFESLRKYKVLSFFSRNIFFACKVVSCHSVLHLILSDNLGCQWEDQLLHTTVSHPLCPTTVSHHCVPQLCPTTVSNHCVPQLCPTTVSSTLPVP